MASDGHSEPKRKRRRSHEDWAEVCRSGGPLDREDEEFDRWNGLGEYSEDRCRPDGFYLGQVPGNPAEGGGKWLAVQTMSAEVQQRAKHRELIPSGKEYKTAAASFAAAAKRLHAEIAEREQSAAPVAESGSEGDAERGA